MPPLGLECKPALPRFPGQCCLFLRWPPYTLFLFPASVPSVLLFPCPEYPFLLCIIPLTLQFQLESQLGPQFRGWSTDPQSEVSGVQKRDGEYDRKHRDQPQSPALPQAGYVTWDRSLSLCGPQFPNLSQVNKARSLSPWSSRSRKGHKVKQDH